MLFASLVNFGSEGSIVFEVLVGKADRSKLFKFPLLTGKDSSHNIYATLKDDFFN